MPSRALLLLNPGARRGGEASLETITGRLAALGLGPVPMPMPAPGRVPELVRAHRDSVDRVIVAGGDGTLNAVVQGLVGAALPLGIIPLGTANNLARTLGLPDSVEEACQVIAAGRRCRIDLGWVNGQYFLTTASVGLSVAITRELSARAKRRWGPAAYAFTAGRVLVRSRPFDAELVWPGGRRVSRTVQVVIGNGRYYGAALAVAEDAAIDDATLDVYSLEIRHWWELLALAPSLKWGSHGERRRVEVLRTASLEVRTRRPRAINLDGEIGGRTPARFRVVPGAIEVFVPAEAA